MKITTGTVATFHYRLLNGEKEIENSQGGEPTVYLHGYNNMIVGVEEAMEGRETNDEFTVICEPVKAYGLRQENSTMRVPVKHLFNAKKLKGNIRPGMVVNINTDKGVKQATVIKAGRTVVDVDTNHPLAGVTLTFEIEIESVREATNEEIVRGRV